MKIGIIGLQPKQIADLKGRAISFGVEYFDQKSYHKESVTAFARQVDRVVILMPHVPKSALEGVPQDKRHMMVGSISTVIRYLESQRAMRLIEESNPTDIKPLEVRKPPKLAPRPEGKVAHAVVKPATVPEDKKEDLTGAPPLLHRQRAAIISSAINPPEDPPYTWIETRSKVFPNNTGAFNYEILDAAELGDVVRFHRDPGEPLARYKARVASLRNYRRCFKGQVFDAYLYDQYVDMHFVLVTARSEVNKERRESAKPKPKTLRTQQDEPKADTAPVVAVEAIEPSTAAEQVPVVVTKVSDLALEPFWCQAFVALLGQGRSVEEAGAGADEALQQRQLRFN